MREWLCVALAATSLACSGGRDIVDTVGGGREYEGPGASDTYVEGNGTVNATTSISTLFALCIKACAHVHAADCEGAPAHEVDDCELKCQSMVGATPGCTDEAAAVHACTSSAKITCGGGITDLPVVNGCDSQTSELTKCTAPGSECVVVLESEDVCESLGFPIFLFCSAGVTPPEQCLQVASDAFCCP